jgi:hypothetical protein
VRRRLSRRRVASRRRGRRLLLVSLLAVACLVVVAVVARVALLRTAIDAALAAQGFSDPQYRIAAVGLTSTRIVDVKLGEELAARELSLHYRPLQLTQLQLDGVDAAGLRVDLSGMGGAAPGPLARLLSGGGQSAVGQSSEVPNVPTIHVADGTLRVPGDISVSLSDLHVASREGGAGYDASAGKIEVTRQAQKIALADVTAAVDLDGGNASGPTVRFAIATLSHTVPQPMVAPLAVNGTVTRLDGIWRLTAIASAAGKARLMLAASYDRESGSAEGRLTLPSTAFAAGALQPRDIVPPLAVLDSVTGTAEGHLALRWHGGKLVPEGALTLDDVGFEAAGLPIENLSVRLGIAGDAAQPILHVQKARLTIAGGALAMDDATLRPLADRNKLVLQAQGIDLGQVLSALDVEGVSGEGHIDGRIPFVLSDGSVAIDGGKLEAQGAGVLRIASRDAAAALAQGGADVNLLLQALADFHYERLALSIDKPLSGESQLTLHTLGHNPAVLDGHPFQINVTVTTNLDKILEVVTAGGRLSQDIIRAIVGAHR